MLNKNYLKKWKFNKTKLINSNIYKDEDEEVSGKQFPTDTGPIDILAISKDKKEYLVIELKKGRASDSVVGQVQRYMGFIKDEYNLEGNKVKVSSTLGTINFNNYKEANLAYLEE